jgi:hypothetical protein
MIGTGRICPVRRASPRRGCQPLAEHRHRSARQRHECAQGPHYLPVDRLICSIRVLLVTASISRSTRVDRVRRVNQSSIGRSSESEGTPSSRCPALRGRLWRVPGWSVSERRWPAAPHRSGRAVASTRSRIRVSRPAVLPGGIDRRMALSSGVMFPAGVVVHVRLEGSDTTDRSGVAGRLFA